MKRVAVFLMLMACAACHKEETQVSYAVQLQKDIGVIDQYLADNHITAIQDTSGLRYVVTTLGTGIRPAISSKVSLRVTGRLLPGNQVFLSDTLPTTDILSNFSPVGIQTGVQLMSKGSKFTFYVPSGMAYGAGGASTLAVPGNTNVIFDIQLLDDDAQLVKDKAIIDAYLQNHQIIATKDSSGLRYVIDAVGAGNYPLVNNGVIFNYTGTLLSNGSVIGQQTDAEARLGDLIEGIQIGLQKIKPGGRIILYIPSGLAYNAGGTPDGVIPENANLIFDITLTAD